MQVKQSIINIKEIEESPINAQVLNDADFRRLVKNLKKDKCLTSSILIMEQENKKYMCISGHHRLKAALKAGITEAPALIIPEIPESDRIRLQLSHNDINGSPDLEILKILQEKLNEDDFELVEMLQDFKAPKEDGFEVCEPQYKYISVCLLPENFEIFEQLLEDLKIEHADEKILIEKDDFVELEKLMTIAFRKGYKTPGQAFRKFIEIVKANINNIPND